MYHVWPSKPIFYFSFNDLSVVYLTFFCFTTHLVDFIDLVEVILSYSSYIQCLNTWFLSKLLWNEWVSYMDLTYLHNVYETVSRPTLSFTVLHRVLPSQTCLASHIFSKDFRYVHWLYFYKSVHAYLKVITIWQVNQWSNESVAMNRFTQWFAPKLTARH